MARQIPEYVSQLGLGSAPQVQFTDAGANALRGVSAELGTMAADIQRKNSEIADLQIETSYKENLHRIYQENRSDPAAFDASYGAFYKKFSAEAPNTDYKRKLDVQHTLYAQSYRDRAMGQYEDNVEDTYKTQQLKALTINKNMLSDAFKQLEAAKTPEARKSAMALINDLNERDSAILSSKDYLGRNRYSPEAQTRDLMERGKIAFKSLSADKQLEVLGDTKGGWEGAQQLVRKHEGGYNPSDGNTGMPTLYGVSKKWHPEAYEKIAAAQNQSDAAGQAAADAYLKETFWDKNGLDELDPRQQGIVYDGAVNHGTEFVKELVSAAKAGATPGQLLEMRQAEYDRLAASGKYSEADVTSWNNRLMDYQHLAVTDYEQYVDADTKDAILKDARNEKLTEIKMQREDPAKAAMLKGAKTVDDIVASQRVPKQYARVIDNESALATGQTLNQAKDSNDVLSFYAQIQQEYGDYAENAFNDLVQHGKLKPEMNAALGLAGKGKYREYVEILTGLSNTDKAGLNTEFNARGYKSEDLVLRVPAEYNALATAMLNEDSKNQATNAQQMEIVMGVAKMKMMQSGMSYDEAMEFAIAPVFESYSVGMINNVPVRVPKDYDAGLVEELTEDYIANKIPELISPTQADDYVFEKQNIVTILNQEESGLTFYSPTVGVITGKDGKPLQIRFKDLIGNKKPSVPIEMNRQFGPGA